MPANAIALTRADFDQARAGAAIIRELIFAQQSGVAPRSTIDPTDQLRKVGELRDAGVLTPAEFEAKKAAILARP